MCEVSDSGEAEVAVRVGKVATTYFLWTCHKMSSYRFAWEAWHFVTFHVCDLRDLAEAKAALLMGRVAFRRVRRCGDVASRGRRGTL